MDISDEEALKLYEEMLEMFNGNLPNPEHEPKRFAYCVKLFKYYKSLRAEKPE